MTDVLDYGRPEPGRDCNYWAYDPTLRRHARRIYGEDFEWARERPPERGERPVAVDTERDDHSS